MHIDDFNNAISEKVMITHEPISPSYRASLQIDWVPEVSKPEVNVVSSSFNESKDDDVEFFNQESLGKNRAFMNIIWQGMKKTYKLIKNLKEKRYPWAIN